ncbi:MAG: hypothetical protein HUJ42_00970 [Malacoplasma sp.]|nr:hypothetical protein [Malacoplasma sp.]
MNHKKQSDPKKEIAKPNDQDLKISNSIEKISLISLEEEKNFKNIKTAPKNRWYNSIMAFLLSGIFVLLGVIVICLLVYFLGVSV